MITQLPRKIQNPRFVLDTPQRNLRRVLPYRWPQWSRNSRCRRRRTRTPLETVKSATLSSLTRWNTAKNENVHHRRTTKMLQIWSIAPTISELNHLSSRHEINTTQRTASSATWLNSLPPKMPFSLTIQSSIVTSSAYDDARTKGNRGGGDLLRTGAHASNAAKLGVAARQSGSSLPETNGAIFERSPTSRPVPPQTRSCRCLFALESFSRREHPFSPVSTGQHPSSDPIVPGKTRRWTDAGQIESSTCSVAFRPLPRMRSQLERTASHAETLRTGRTQRRAPTNLAAAHAEKKRGLRFTRREWLVTLPENPVFKESPPTAMTAHLGLELRSWSGRV